MKTKQKYGLRKLSIGAVSCLLGSFLYLSGGMVIQAEENTEFEEATSENTSVGEMTEPQIEDIPSDNDSAITPKTTENEKKDIDVNEDLSLKTQSDKVFNTVYSENNGTQSASSVVPDNFMDDVTYYTPFLDWNNSDNVFLQGKYEINVSGDFVLSSKETDQGENRTRFFGVKIRDDITHAEIFQLDENYKVDGKVTILLKEAAIDKYQRKYNIKVEIENVVLYTSHKLLDKLQEREKAATIENMLNDTSKGGVRMVGLLDRFGIGLGANSTVANSIDDLYSGGVNYGANAGYLNGSMSSKVTISIVDDNGNPVEGTFVYGVKDLDISRHTLHASTVKNYINGVYDANAWFLGTSSPEDNITEGITLLDGFEPTLYFGKYASSMLNINEETGEIFATDGSPEKLNAKMQAIYDSLGSEYLDSGNFATDNGTYNSGFVLKAKASGFSFETHHPSLWGGSTLEGKPSDIMGSGMAMLTNTSGEFADPDVLRYDSNGGDGVMSDSEGFSGDPVDVKSNEFTKKGYRFIGWNTKADGTGTNITNTYTLINDFDDVVYAQWEYIPVTKWEDENGAPLKDTVEGTLPDIEGDDVPGYTFIETKPDGNGDITNIYHKNQTHWKDEDGGVIKDTEDGTLPDVEGDDVPGYEFIRTEQKENGDIINIYRKKEVVTTKEETKTPEQLKEEKVVSPTVKTSTNLALIGSIQSMLASLGALKLLKRKK